MTRQSSQRFAEADRRAVLAVDMRRQGKTYREIGEELGISAPNALDAYRRGLRLIIPIEEVHEARQRSLDELDAHLREVREWMTRNHYVVSEGRVVQYEDAPLQDLKPMIECMRLLLQIEKRRAEIIGYDAPKKSSVTYVPESVIEAEIARLEREMERNDRAVVPATASS